MSDANSDQPIDKKPEVSNPSIQTPTKAEELSLTPEDEEILLNRLRELGYVE